MSDSPGCTVKQRHNMTNGLCTRSSVLIASVFTMWHLWKQWRPSVLSFYRTRTLATPAEQTLLTILRQLLRSLSLLRWTALRHWWGLPVWLKAQATWKRLSAGTRGSYDTAKEAIHYFVPNVHDGIRTMHFNKIANRNSTMQRITACACAESNTCMHNHIVNTQQSPPSLLNAFFNVTLWWIGLQWRTS